jgi:hypothetical protein
MADEPRPQLQPTRKNPSLLACIACRRSHMKCDGKGPTCGRCVERGAACVWVESRRGIRPAKREVSSVPSESSSSAASSNHHALPQEHRQLQHQGQQSQQQRQYQQPPQRSFEGILPVAQLSDVWFHHQASVPYLGSTLDSYPYANGRYVPLPSPPATSPGVGNDGTDVLLDLFYKYFHPSRKFNLSVKTVVGLITASV